MSGTYRNYTKRLLIRSFQSIDTHDFFRLFTHPRVNSSLGANPLFSKPHRVIRFLEQMSIQRNAIHSWLLYSIFERFHNRLIGGCGLKLNREETGTEIFYLLYPGYWGKGFAVEACLPVLKNTFVEFHLQNINAYILPENIRGQRVAAKLGFRFLKVVNLNRYGQTGKVQKWMINMRSFNDLLLKKYSQQ